MDIQDCFFRFTLDSVGEVAFGVRFAQRACSAEAKHGFALTGRHGVCHNTGQPELAVERARAVCGGLRLLSALIPNSCLSTRNPCSTLGWHASTLLCVVQLSSASFQVVKFFRRLGIPLFQGFFNNLRILDSFAQVRLSVGVSYPPFMLVTRYLLGPPHSKLFRPVRTTTISNTSKTCSRASCVHVTRSESGCLLCCCMA